MTINITHPLLQVNCFRCGIAYAVPEQWINTKIENDRGIYCPNGHKQHYAHSQAQQQLKDLEAENERLKTELLQEKHNAEQAEGRRRDEAGIVASDDEIAKPVLPAPDEEITELRRTAGGRVVCPRCGPKKTYKSYNCMERHLREDHGDEKTAKRLLSLWVFGEGKS